MNQIHLLILMFLRKHIYYLYDGPTDLQDGIMKGMSTQWAPSGWEILVHSPSSCYELLCVLVPASEAEISEL